MRVNPVVARWLSRELDPGRPPRVYNEYDISRGYADYHAECRMRFARMVRDSESSSPTPLSTKGYEYLDVFTPAYAKSIVNHLRTEHDLSLVKKDSKDLLGWAVSDPDFIRRTLEAVFTEAVDDRLVRFFGSEYLVHWMTFSLTKQAEEQKSVSFRWHCDKGPTAHLKIIVYLNAGAEHGGTTDFVDIDQTREIAERGYLFGWTQARSSDLGHISRLIGRELRSDTLEMQAGQGVVFQPSRVLHRGVSPTRGDRCALTLCLLPSPVRWEVALARGALSDLGVDASWHRDARELLGVVEPLDLPGA